MFIYFIIYLESKVPKIPTIINVWEYGNQVTRINYKLRTQI